MKNSQELEKVIDDFKKKICAMNGEKNGHEMLKLLNEQRSLNLAKRDAWILWVLGISWSEKRRALGYYGFLRVKRDGVPRYGAESE